MTIGIDTFTRTGAWAKISLPDQPLSPLRLLSAITIAYFAFAALFLIAVGTNPLHLVNGVLRALPLFFMLAKSMTPTWMLVGLVGVFAGVPALRRRLIENWREIVLITIYASLFTLAFGMVKNHLPAAVPFWADGMLTELDKMMTPREKLAWLDRIGVGPLMQVYANGWVFLATFFPAVMAIADPNAARRRLFTLLWAACWVGLGNVMAVCFMSMGPIFLDRLPGADISAYGDIYRMLERPDAAHLLMLKDNLWAAYAEGEYMVGSGISAFPSVHVGMATVIALYIASVLRTLARAQPALWVARALRIVGIVLPVMLVLVYQVITVYLGWHYAIDGYASIVLVALAFWALARRMTPSAPQPSP